VMIHTELKLTPRHGFGVLRVGTFVEACTKQDVKVRIIHEPTDSNPAHSAVHRYPQDNDELSAVLANLAGANLTLVSELSHGSTATGSTQSCIGASPALSFRKRTEPNMIPDIGLMIGPYIVTRMAALLGQSSP
jgi:hypothetical protein